MTRIEGIEELEEILVIAKVRNLPHAIAFLTEQLAKLEAERERISDPCARDNHFLKVPGCIVKHNPGINNLVQHTQEWTCPDCGRVWLAHKFIIQAPGLPQWRYSIVKERAHGAEKPSFTEGKS